VAPRSSVVADTEWSNFVANFQAHVPGEQAWCMGLLRQTLASASSADAMTAEKRKRGSQYQQDVFVIRNVYGRMIVDGAKGFYVDSGANDAETLSNTLFFDVCLGWKGLCVEPNTKYHRDIEAKRSCTLVPECISDVPKEMELSLEAAGSHVTVVAGSGATRKEVIKVMCRPLDDMLRRDGNGRTHVDFWSLDVEGFEMAVLQVVPWDRITFGAILIEDFWLSNRVLDFFMTGVGFAKIQQLGIDALYLPWKGGAAATRWVPSDWEAMWQLQETYRNDMRKKGLLAKDY
jgi:FkbM family methyltransferase